MYSPYYEVKQTGWQYIALLYSFPNFQPVIVPCRVLTVDSWLEYKFVRSGIPISLRIFQFLVIHTVKSFHVVNEVEIDIFLELPCFLHDPVNVGKLISGFSAFSKCSLYIWKFSVHMLLKPTLTNMAAFEMSVTVWLVWTFFGIALLWNCNENWYFPVLWPLLSLPNLLTYWIQHFNSFTF